METSGMVRISLLPGGEAGWCYYSEPVVLMPEEGDLWIDLALVTSDGQVVFGDMGPFTDCEYTEEPVQAEIGALLDPMHSAFRVGVRLKEDTEAEEVFVRWRAVRMAPLGGGAAGPKVEEKEEKRPDPTFYIEAVPGSIGKGRKFMFLCHRPEEDTEPVVWSVVGEDAGTIDAYGMYTAPDRIGVFEVQAALGGRKTSAYVVVKETEE